MDASVLKYGLTEEQRKTFDETGYLIVEDVLSPEHVAALTEQVDRIFDESVQAGHDGTKALFRANFIPDHRLFVDLVDYEKVLPKVWGILGWNIYLYHAHLIITPPSGQQANDATFNWHQDSGRMNWEMGTEPQPRVSIKVAYFLTDLTEPGRGNFWIVPRSQSKNSIDRPADGNGQPAGAIPVRVKPGTAVFFDRRLWHSASPNWSELTRKVLFYGYGYRWIRTKDDMTVSQFWAESDPIRRQLLGAGSNANSYYSPTEEDAPLRQWLREHAPDQVS